MYSTRKCLAVLLCVCILQHQTGGKFLPGLGSVREFIGKVASAVPSFITKGMPLGMGDAKSIGMAIGKNVIRPPLLGAERLINAKDSLLEMGAELMKSVVKGARLVLKKEWEAVQTIKLPGWKYIMVFPNAVISVVDKATDTAWFLVSETGRKVVAAEAFMIYASMKVISETIGPAMRLLYLDCIRMQRMKQKIGTFMVDELEFAECKVCGLPNLEAVNNVTVTSEGKSFMIVEVPYLARNISVKITAANVTDYSGYLLENTPMAVTIKKTRLKGSVYFTRGTLLKFFTVKLRVIGFDDFNIKIDVPRENRTPIMDIVEGISDVLANMVKNAINRSLQRFEKQLSKIITQEAPSNTPPSD